MRIVKADYEIMNPNLDDPQTAIDIYKLLEKIGRTCYVSGEQITENSAENFLRRIIKNGHEAMLEHAHLTVKFTIDRGISHELVRHRLASFAQESTRYCNYHKEKFGDEIAVIEPCFFDDIPDDRKETILKILEASGEDDADEFKDFEPTDHERQYANWYMGCEEAETAYFMMLDLGSTPQEARDVLPNSLKTDVVMTANIREWRHFFKLRAAGVTGKPHPQMLEVASKLPNECREKLPVLFDDILPMGEEKE